MPTHLLDQEVKVLGNLGSEACIYKISLSAFISKTKQRQKIRVMQKK